MKAIIALIAIIAIAGCVSPNTYPAAPLGQQPSQNDVGTGQQVLGPKDAAVEYTTKTYINTADTTYSDFSYNVVMNGTDSATVTIRYMRVLSAPAYTLTRLIEQVITVEKRGSFWVATSTPNGRIVSEGTVKK